MQITLSDGSLLTLPEGTTVAGIAQAIGEGLKKNAVAGEVDGVLVDLSYAVRADARVRIITLKDKEGLDIYRHTCAHVLAQAIKSIYPTCSLAIGPTIENGFYYDVDFKTPITQDALATIEEEMKLIVKGNFRIERFELPRKVSVALMTKFKEPYKVQLIKDLPEDSAISFYRQGDFTDLCRGPHLPSTGMIKAFRLTSVTGAYWRGDSKNKMLTRIYGTAFAKKSALEEYLAQVEEAKKRDHNRIGRDLGYFTTVEAIGQGLPVMLEKGSKVLQVLQRFVEDEEYKRGYILTKTPLFAKSDFYKISGHWDHYRDGMFVMGEEGKDKEVFALRPMTCPFQFQVYLNKPRSYKDLPMRLAETSTLFRNEDSGEMHGLIRVRQFTISEGHIACTPDQVESEFRHCLDLSKFMLTAVGLQEDVYYRFSRRDPADKSKYIGSDEDWESVEGFMKKILDDFGIPYTEAKGEAAFYGPKLDIQIKNVFGKEDTLVTVQIDFQLAKRFRMLYTDAEGEKKYPYVIHRTSLGCYERTLALMLEKYAGALPLWVSATQVAVLDVSEKSEEYSREVFDRLLAAGIRPSKDLRSEKIGKKIREAQLEKVPYMLVIGEAEAADGEVSVRRRDKGDLGKMKLDDFVSLCLSQIRSREIW